MKQRDLNEIHGYAARQLAMEVDAHRETGAPPRPWVGIDFKGEDLRGLNFIEAEGTGPKGLYQAAEFQGADLRGARLQGLALDGAEFQGADLRGARLQKASFSNANFDGADLRGVRFRGANLHDAKLAGAITDKYTFRGARMNGEQTVWETVQQKAATAWETVQQKAGVGGERQPARQDERMEERTGDWRDAARQGPLERAKNWLGAQQGAVVERMETWRDDRAKAAAERAYPAAERAGATTARESSSAAPAPTPQADRDPAVGQHLAAARSLTYEEGRAAYQEVLERQDEIKTIIAGMADPAAREKAARLFATVQQDAAARQRSPERAAERDR